MTQPSGYSGALVFFGAMGDSACEKICPSLQAMLERGHLDVRVKGVAKAGCNPDQLKAPRRAASNKTGASMPRPWQNYPARLTILKAAL
jgi:glucose-6-phosphate 1-dehydrogenase